MLRSNNPEQTGTIYFVPASFQEVYEQTASHRAFRLFLVSRSFGNGTTGSKRCCPAGDAAGGCGNDFRTV
jgi:hypothetical protein